MTAYAYALAEMLIRRPVAEVFEAFVDPAITTQFWFTHSTGRLDQHREVEVDVGNVPTQHRSEGDVDHHPSAH